MAEVNAKDLTTKTSPASTDSMLLFGTSTNEGAKITVDNLADNILGRLTTKTFTNQVGGSSAATILAQLSTLYSTKMYDDVLLANESFTTPNGTNWNKTGISFTPRLDGLLTVGVENTDGYPTSIVLCTQSYANEDYPAGKIYMQNSLAVNGTGYFFLRSKKNETLYLYVKWSKVGSGKVSVQSVGVPGTAAYSAS